MAQLLSGTRVYGNTSIDSQLIVGNVTPYHATSNTTGSLIITGGVGVAGNVYAAALYTNGLFYAANGLPISTGGGGVSPSGYLNNSVIFANTTGFLSNTANLTFSNTNILRVNGSIALSNSLTANTATIVFNAANNSIDFIF